MSTVWASRTMIPASVRVLPASTSAAPRTPRRIQVACDCDSGQQEPHQAVVDVFRFEGPAVVEAHVAAQVKAIDVSLLQHFPLLGQARHELRALAEQSRGSRGWPCAM